MTPSHSTYFFSSVHVFVTRHPKWTPLFISYCPLNLLRFCCGAPQEQQTLHLCCLRDILFISCSQWMVVVFFFQFKPSLIYCCFLQYWFYELKQLPIVGSLDCAKFQAFFHIGCVSQLRNEICCTWAIRHFEETDAFCVWKIWNFLFVAFFFTLYVHCILIDIEIAKRWL